MGRFSAPAAAPGQPGTPSTPPADITADFPEADPSYFNVTIQIDPTWIHVDEFRTALNKSLGYVDRDKLVFVFSPMSEEGLAENATVNYAPTDVLGRTEGYRTYIGNNSREIPMTFHFVYQGEAVSVDPDPNEDGTGTGNSDPDAGVVAAVIEPTRWLDALRYPIQSYQTGLSIAPPPLLLQVGRLLLARVILSDYGYTWRGPFVPGTMYPSSSEVRCTFTVVRNIPVADQVGLNGSSDPNSGNNQAQADNTVDQISRFVSFTNYKTPQGV